MRWGYAHGLTRRMCSEAVAADIEKLLGPTV